MSASDFRANLLAYFDSFGRTLATDTDDWVVKGFIDVYRNVYAISVDTKVVSKVIEWRIASDRPGSGNTKNIGSVRNIQALVEGSGPFASYGEEVFDDYWMSYLTEDMARTIDSNVPYRNLEEYWKWRNRASRLAQP